MLVSLACVFAAAGFFGQEFDWHDAPVVALLVVLEGVLSIDNALVLGLLAKRVRKDAQKKALTYGLVGAFIFRLIAVATATYLLKWRIVKLLGGAYLVYIAVKHVFFERGEMVAQKVVATPGGGLEIVPAVDDSPLATLPQPPAVPQASPLPNTEREASAGFWSTVLVIELTDIAFAVDSILAAIAMVGAPPEDLPPEAPHPKLWVVLLGGMVGVVLMRFAAIVFIKLLEKFPRFEEAAYLLVAVIGVKLLADWGFNTVEHPHRLDFHDWQSPAFWVFWVLMMAAFCSGFLPPRQTEKNTHDTRGPQ